MDGQSFHTSLLGGFRKKDVIRYLAAEKQRQEEELNQLRNRQQEMQQTLAEASENQAGGWQEEALQAQIAALQEENALQAQELATLRARIRVSEGGKPDADALRKCQEELAAQRQRADVLEEQLRLQQNAETPAPDALPEARLRELCRRLEQSLELLDKAMDGPRTMICYPVSEEDRALLIRYGVVPEHLPKAVLQEKQASAPETVPETAPEEEELPLEMPETEASLPEPSEDAPAEMPEEPSEALPEEILEETPEEISEAPSEEVPEISAEPAIMPEAAESADEAVSRLLERVRGWRK